MNTKRFEGRSASNLGWLTLYALASLAGCFSKPSSDITKRVCSTDQQCPVGYSCLAPGEPGGCCKGTPCPASLISDAENLDALGKGDDGGPLPVDALPADRAAIETAPSSFDGPGGSLDGTEDGNA